MAKKHSFPSRVGVKERKTKVSFGHEFASRPQLQTNANVAPVSVQGVNE